MRFVGAGLRLALAVAWVLRAVPLPEVAASAPAKEFKSHQTFETEFHHVRKRRRVDSTQHDLAVSIRMSESGENVTLDLRLNRDLIPEGFFQKYHVNGSHRVDRPGLNEAELCHYLGRVRGSAADSWAAVSACDGELVGVFFDGREMHYLQGDLIYKRSDLVRVKRDVPPVGDPSNEIDSEPKKRNGTGVKGPWNSNGGSRYVELVLVVDNKEYKEHGSDLSKIYKICKDVANIMNALYTPLNIYITLVGVVVWTEYDEIKLDTNGDRMLTNFLHYRRQRLVKDHPNDNAQLLTGVQFDGGVVGKALKGPICTYEFSGGVNMWHSDVVGLLATTVAHEMGHNFGMEHDDETVCDCPEDKCIMSPSSSDMRPSFWSSCSHRYIARAFEHGMDYCLRNKPSALFQAPVCGNGFVEEGEECDCGLPEHCDNPCCHAPSCRLAPEARCATGQCCDLTTCLPRSAGTMCRSADKECDLAEFCDGRDEYCPADIFKADGTSCQVGRAYCYKGDCRTHSDQCKLLWGPTGQQSDDRCYEQNKKGTRNGNCGYDRLTKSYVSCPPADVRCGMLQCTHLNERLEFGMESVAILSYSFINSGDKFVPCRTALVDLGIDEVDPGLAPDGAKCGLDRLCVNRKCVAVSSLEVGPSSCPDNCNGRGVCNDRGHCHCDPGYGPPTCLDPGPGGSIDSGPVSDSDSSWITTLSVLLFVLLVIVCPVVTLIFIWKRKPDLLDKVWRKKERPPPSYESAMEQSSKNQSPSSHALLPHSNSAAVNGETFTTDSEGGSSCISKKKNFMMEFISKSMAFPTPKFPNAIKQSSNRTKYEIKVEHQEPKATTDEVDISSPTIDRRQENQYEVSVTKVDTTVSLNNISTSSSLTTFGPRPPRLLPPYKPSLPLSKSFPLRTETGKQDQESNCTTNSSTYSSISSSSVAAAEDKKPLSFPQSSTYSNCSTQGQTAQAFSSSAAEVSSKNSKSLEDEGQEMKLTKTATLPFSLNQKGGEHSGHSHLPKSSTLPIVQNRPSISRPVLQAATPSAVSLIEKAPSTGVSQSSILHQQSKSGGCKTSRGVVFCDPLTLPSPTNPNNPPIIHQNSTKPEVKCPKPEVNGPKPEVNGPKPEVNRVKPEIAPNTATFTPKWTTEPKPLFSDVCRVDKEEAKSSKPKSPPEPKSTPAADLRSLQISNPILQTEVKLKTDLVPVSRQSPSSPVKRQAPQPPVVEGGTPVSRLKRPNSIATSRPVRPSAPPPRPPPRQEVKEPIYDIITEGDEGAVTPGTLSRRASDTISTGSSTDGGGGGELMREILKEMKSKPPPQDPQEESIYSTLIRKDKKNRKKKS